ncbi:glycoside hydrolase family 9 protein, partial [Balneolaceae bacterium ANBcel3]|nr:glycoside hydrolase family 9 protein [Balneolaceae bacterium ANBcel3]
ASLTDGLPYNPELEPYEIAPDGLSSGLMDDMWAFTSRNPDLDLRAAAMFAGASRALRGYNDDLADRALYQSKRLLAEATELLADQPEQERQSWWRGTGDIATNLQLYISTGEQQYADRYQELLWTALDRNVSFILSLGLHGIPHMDASFKEKLRPYVEQYKEYILALEEDNPYGVPIGLGNWAGSGGIVNFGTTVIFANKHFPDIIDADHAFKATNWIYGCHPYHNYSLVATVGATRPKEVFYGNNRADFSFIPGNLAPGILFRQPDHFENYDDWPFLWGQNEGTIGGNTSYLFFGSAFRNMIAN